MMAIPFHSSVRIKLGAGSKILNKDKEPIGINVSAKTIKNKVSAPFRTCNFEIHFGKGVKEHEQIFDLLRKHGSETIDDHVVEVAGAGAWKTLHVYSPEGEAIIEKKFYKGDFDKLIDDKLHGPWIDKLLEKAMIRKNSTDDPAIDHESYVEIEEVASQVMDANSDAFEMLK
jgi:hypothetical protein